MGIPVDRSLFEPKLGVAILKLTPPFSQGRPVILWTLRTVDPQFLLFEGLKPRQLKTGP